MTCSLRGLRLWFFAQRFFSSYIWEKRIELDPVFELLLFYVRRLLFSIVLIACCDWSIEFCEFISRKLKRVRLPLLRAHTRLCVCWVSLCARYISDNGRDVKYFTSKIGACAHTHSFVCVCVGFLYVRVICWLTDATSNTPLIFPQLFDVAPVSRYISRTQRNPTHTQTSVCA